MISRGWGADRDAIAVMAAGTNVAGSVDKEMRTSTPCASICAAVGGLALLFASCPAARAADGGKQIATAAQHAGYAADSTAIGMAHAHLHHTINCLVGPQGDGFDAKELNPCKGFGNGAILPLNPAVVRPVLAPAVRRSPQSPNLNRISCFTLSSI